MNLSEQLPTMTIESVLERWPETAVVFQRYQLACVGCVMAPFCKIADAISIYNLPANLFITDLLEIIPHDDFSHTTAKQHIHSQSSSTD